MKSIKFLSWCLVGMIFNCIGQSSEAQSLQGQPLIDSLLRGLPKAKDDTSKAWILYKLSCEFAPNDSKAALDYANKCMDISRRANWRKGIGMAYFAFANAYFETTDYSRSLQNSLKAYEIAKTFNEKNAAATLMLIGSTYYRLGYNPKAIENYFAALRLFETINNKEGIENCYINIGNVYSDIPDNDKALECYNKALSTCRELNDKHDMAIVLGNIASVFFEKGKYDSAHVYYQENLKFFKETEINDEPELSRIYFNLGNLSKKQYDAKSAYEYFMRAVEIDKRLGITMELADDYGGIGALYFDLAADSSGKYIVSPLFKTNRKSLLQKAQYYFAQTLAMLDDKGNIFLRMNYSKSASETQEMLGNYKKALAFQKKYNLYKDSIFNDENKKKIAALENQRLAEVKDKQIQLLNKDKALEASEIKRQALIKNIIIGAVAVAAIFAFVFTRSFIHRQKVIFDKQVLQTEMKALRAQMNPHFIFNSLHSINKYVMQNDKVNASEYLSKFAKLMRLVLENCREQEVPLENDLSALDLYMQLESLRFQNRFKYSIEIDRGIDKENTLIPPLMLQPFAENAIVHGIKDKENGLIKINIRPENDMIRCIVEDNGTGWEASPVTGKSEGKQKSFALKIIQERLNIINQFKKAKAAIHIFDLKDAEDRPSGLRIELLLPLQLAF